MQKTIEQKKKLVDKEKEDCKVEEEGAKKDKEEADIIKKDCDDALALVMPIYRQAMEAVKSLNSSDVTELKGFANPPKAAIQVARALIIIFQTPKKDIIMVAAEDGRGKVPDYWNTAKKNILTGGLL
jgi:dynein heavy chain